MRTRLICLLMSLHAALSAAETIQLPCVADVWVSRAAGEQATSMGKTARLKIKALEEFSLLDFDLAPLAGRQVNKAWLYLRAVKSDAEFERLKIAHLREPLLEIPFRFVGVSTVAARWNEGSQRWRYREDPDGHGATWLEAMQGQSDWAWPGSRLHDVIFGNGGSIGRRVEIERLSDRWFRVPVAPAQLAQLQRGEAQGLLISEDTYPGFAGALNGFIHSRESRWPPYLEVVARAPDTAASVQTRQPPAVSAPTTGSLPLPASALQTARFDGKVSESLRPLVQVLPVGATIDPRSGAVVDSGANSFASLWNDAQGGIAVQAARGQFAAFHLVLKRLRLDAPADYRVTVSALTRGDGRTLSPASARLFNTWYMRTRNGAGHEVWIGEYALPSAGPVSVPNVANEIPDQQFQDVLVDWHIPKSTAPGVYRGSIVIESDESGDRQIPLAVTVRTAVIPDVPTFRFELNSYFPPALEGPSSDYFRASHRLAHYHRATLNSLPYRQQKGIFPDWIIPGLERGTPDWTAFDRAFAPLFDGSLFADNPRSRVPVDVFYLPLHEFYPLDYREHFSWRTFSAALPEITRYRLSGDDLAEGLDEVYRQAFVGAARAIAEHVEARGWHHTRFQFYLNNKAHRGGGIFWNLDEPASQADFSALRGWGELWRAGTRAAAANLVFRADVSRPQLMFNQLDDIVDEVYVNTGSLASHRSATLDAMQRRGNFTRFLYGSFNRPGASNRNTMAWVLHAYLTGMAGIMPWNATRALPLDAPAHTDALLVHAGGTGFDGPVVSLRVIAAREAVELVELMTLVLERYRLGRDAFSPMLGLLRGGERTERAAAIDEAAGGYYPQFSLRVVQLFKQRLFALLEP